MNLAPLANVVAYLDRNPARLAGMKQALDGRFDAVWSPREGCVMATRALPRSVPDGQELRAAGLAFAEGRDSLDAPPARGLSLESLPGNVGFVRAEPDGLLVVRSGAGTVPWYAWHDGERAIVATMFTELVRLLPVAPEFDPLVCGMWATGNPTFPGGRTFLQGVMAVAPGDAAEVGPGRPASVRSWWNPWPDELPWPTRSARAEHVQRFREAVLAVLDRELADEPVNLLTLSGGVDSATLAYLVGRHLGRPLAALSFVPPVDAPEAELEASYLDPIGHDLGIAPHTRFPLSAADRLAMAARTPQVAFPVFHPALQVLPTIARDHRVEVLVGGEFADEVCGGWFALPDWLDAVSLPRLVTQLRILPRGRPDLVAWARRRRPGRVRPGPWRTALPEWVRPEIDAEFQAWRTSHQIQLRTSSAPHRHQRAVLNWLNGSVAMNWEVCSALKVRRAFPFLSPEVLTVISACHPAELLGPGDKRLERQAFSEVVPQRQLQRPDKGGWGVDEDSVPAVPTTVPASMASVFRSDLESATSLQAISVEVMSRFADQVADSHRGRTRTI